MATTTMPAPARTRREAGRATYTVTPRVDIYETERAYVLLADMPGVQTDGLEIVTEREELILRGRVQIPEITPEYEEFELADYYRAFVLTEDLDTQRITATLRDGLLRLEIPKSARMQPKKIPVRAG